MTKIITIAFLLITVSALSGLYVSATTQHSTWYLKQDRLPGPIALV